MASNVCVYCKYCMKECSPEHITQAKMINRCEGFRAAEGATIQAFSGGEVSLRFYFDDDNRVLQNREEAEKYYKLEKEDD